MYALSIDSWLYDQSNNCSQSFFHGTHHLCCDVNSRCPTKTISCLKMTPSNVNIWKGCALHEGCLPGTVTRPPCSCKTLILFLLGARKIQNTPKTMRGKHPVYFTVLHQALSVVIGVLGYDHFIRKSGCKLRRITFLCTDGLFWKIVLLHWYVCQKQLRIKKNWVKSLQDAANKPRRHINVFICYVTTVPSQSSTWSFLSNAESCRTRRSSDVVRQRV